MGPPSSAETTEAGILRRLGDYDLLEEIGRGGMGVVFKARQRSLDRMVAVKLILAGEFASETAVARFREEAEVIASLDHPNIVSIFEVGEIAGLHFFSMKFIAGESLASRLQRVASASAARECFGPSRLSRANDDRAPSLRKAAKLVAKVARALQFVHQQGIIHRDVSPENILLDERDEPWVTDFGLARLAPEGRLTRSYTIVGKPDYMSPEQSDPTAPCLTTSSDIFSLGAVFYELLTGKPPFSAPTPLATLECVRLDEPKPPSALNSAVDRDLDTICLNCLAKEPADRYESAAALAEDIDRWLRGEPIQARPTGLIERSWKWVKRHPLKTTAVGSGCAAVVLPLLLWLYFFAVVVPEEARTHTIIGRDLNVDGFQITFETGQLARVSMNFDAEYFRNRPRQARLYFTNIPPAALSSVTNLRCQIMADMICRADQPRSPIVRHGDSFTIASSGHWDRAYYIAPIGGWQGQDVLKLAPAARFWITGIGGD